MRSFSPAAFIAALFGAQVAGMSGIVTFPALVPTFQAEWALSNTQAGWISGIYFAGYVAAVPVLSSLTDRVDPRRVYLSAMALGVLASVGFAVSASGLWTASLWRCLQGVAFGGIHMPGLKVLADAMPKHHQSRAVAIYTASFTVGTSLSFFLAGELAPAFGWHWTFALLALGPLAGLVAGVLVIAPRPPTGETPRTALLDFRPVLRNRRSLAYMIAYAVHNAESSCLRAWAVAFLVFSQAQQAAVPSPAGWSATTITTAAYLGGLPAIIIANELARRFGRRVVIVAVMAASASVGVLLGLAATGAFWLVVVLMFLYGFTVPADSGTINAGLVATADPRHRGRALAMQAVFGFTGAFVAPVLFGAVLDWGGGEASAGAWILAFAAMAAMVALGPLALMTLERSTPRPAG